MEQNYLELYVIIQGKDRQESMFQWRIWSFKEINEKWVGFFIFCNCWNMEKILKLKYQTKKTFKSWWMLYLDDIFNYAKIRKMKHSLKLHAALNKWIRFSYLDE